MPGGGRRPTVNGTDGYNTSLLWRAFCCLRDLNQGIGHVDRGHGMLTFRSHCASLTGCRGIPGTFSLHHTFTRLLVGLALMATVIERERPIERSERYVERDRTDTGGWVVAIILLVLLALGIVWWLRYQAPAAAPATSNPATINVTVPGTSDNAGSGAGTPNNSGGSGTDTGGTGNAGGGAGTGGGMTGGTGTTL